MFRIWGYQGVEMGYSIMSMLSSMFFISKFFTLSSTASHMCNSKHGFLLSTWRGVTVPSKRVKVSQDLIDKWQDIGEWDGLSTSVPDQPVVIPARHIPMFWHAPFMSYLDAHATPGVMTKCWFLTRSAWKRADQTHLVEEGAESEGKAMGLQVDLCSNPHQLS